MAHQHKGNQESTSEENDPLEQRLQEKRQALGKSAYYNQSEWDALIECLPRRHLRQDPTSQPRRENWPKLQVAQPNITPRSQSRSHESQRLQTAPSTPISTKSSGRSASKHVSQTDTLPNVSSTDADTQVQLGSIASNTQELQGSQSAQIHTKKPSASSISRGKARELPRTGGTRGQSTSPEQASEQSSPQRQVWGHSWWPIPESAIDRQHQKSVQQSMSTSVLEEGSAKNRLKSVNIERASQERKNPRTKSESEAKTDAAIVKLSGNPALVNKTSINQLKMLYGIPDHVARRLKKDARKEIRRRDEVSKQRHEQSEQKLKDFQAEWEEKLVRAREAQAAKKEQRFNNLMQQVDEGWEVLEDIKNRVLKKEASKEYEQTRQLHDQWNTFVHDRMRKSIANYLENGSLAKRRKKRLKQYEAYLRAFGHENFYQYDPMASKDQPIRVGYIADPIQAGLSKSDDEERALFEDPSSPEQKKRQEAVQKLFFDSDKFDQSGQRQPRKRGHSSKQDQHSPSKADAMDLVERVRMAEKEETNDRRWTLPPLLWSSGVINDTTYVRQYKTLDEFTSTPEEMEAMVIQEEKEAENERTK